MTDIRWQVSQRQVREPGAEWVVLGEIRAPNLWAARTLAHQRWAGTLSVESVLAIESRARERTHEATWT